MIETIQKAEEVSKKLSESSKSGNRLLLSLLNKCIYQTKIAFNRNEKSINELCAITRYNLEALIDIKLCSQNEGYTLAMEFNQKQVLINLYKTKLLQYEKEISLLKKYQKKEEDIIEECTKFFIKNKDVRLFHESRNAEMEKLSDSFFDESIYFTDSSVIQNGYGHTAYFVEKNIYPQLKKDIQQLEKEQCELSDKAKDNLAYQLLFGLKPQMKTSEISSRIQYDSDTWKKKADVTELSDEYEFIYRYTSSIIHCVGLSYLSKKNADDNDIKILEAASKRYIRMMTKILQQRLCEDDIKLYIQPNHKEKKK